jgi:hypothetical protein
MLSIMSPILFVARLLAPFVADALLLGHRLELFSANLAAEIHSV